jgi:LPS-assembly protein
MTRAAALTLFPWLLGAIGSSAQILPEPEIIPEVDVITPVPIPEIPIGGPDGMTPALPDEAIIQNIGGGRITANLETGNVRFHGPGIKVVGDTGLEMFADSAVWDPQARRAVLEGNVSIYQGNILQRGSRATYDFDTNVLEVNDLRASVDPVILEAGRFTVEEINGRRVFVGRDAGITTHDVEQPGYWIRAAETRVYPDDRITFRNLRLYAGENPVFWLPYLSQPMDGELGYHFVPGARTNWGAYLLNTYGIMLGGRRNGETGENDDGWLLSRWHFDLRALRGVGVGLDLVDTRSEINSGLGGLGLYFLHDRNPEFRRAGLPRLPISPERYRAELKHRLPLDFGGDASWYLDTNLTRLSDQYYLEDFDPARYRSDPAPDNTIGLYRRGERSLASLFTRLRVNDYYRADTRLPMAAFDLARGPLPGGLPILHEGTASLGVIGIQTGDITRRNIIEPLLALPPGSPQAGPLLNQLQGYERFLAERIRALPPGDPRIPALRAQLIDTSFTRFHTYQELSAPLSVGGWLNVVPQVGVGHTRYAAVEGPASSDARSFFHAGTEASLKWSSDLGDHLDHRWGLNGLLHVVQPYANWSLLAAESLADNFPRVDRLTFTTRPRTLSPARFTATDTLESWNILRLGTRNRLLTRRDGQSHEWLYLNTYVDAFLQDPELDRTISNLYNDAVWEPLPWMSVGLETQFPVISGGSGFSELATTVRFLPRPDLEVALGYRFLDNHPVLTDSNRVDLGIYARLTENWGVGIRHVLELDDGTMEVQQYTVHRDLGHWVAGFGVTHRDNRLRDEFGVVFSLTLKDFPSVSLPFRIDAE